MDGFPEVRRENPVQVIVEKGAGVEVSGVGEVRGDVINNFGRERRYGCLDHCACVGWWCIFEMD